MSAIEGSVRPGEDFAMTRETGEAARTLGAIAKALARADRQVPATDRDGEAGRHG